ncbi:MAG: DUF362 domain-containing protein [Acidobacteria bacterium]|nr:DUF362 domain-containing protein [Acidobacteriota bacterium]
MSSNPHDRGMPRRDALRRIAGAGLVLGGCAAAGALGVVSPGRWKLAPGAQSPRDFRVPDDPARPRVAIARAGAVAALVRASVERVGGIGRFVRRGEAVLVKPNMAWDRLPEHGANTNPEVVAEVVRLCREAGAARVVVADVPCHDEARVAERSGIARAAREAGAEVVLPSGDSFRMTRIGGTVLEDWEVLATVLAVDRMINVPIVKDHGLTRLTCCMKNLYGLLGGRRERLHQQAHESITDLAAAFRPTLTIVDATRVMTSGGPTGGRPDNVRLEGAIAAGTDMVALDAWGARLLGVDPADVGHIVLAEGRGIGSRATQLDEFTLGGARS